MTASKVSLSAMRFGAPVALGVGLRSAQNCAPQFAAELRRIADDVDSGALYVDAVDVHSSMPSGEPEFITTVVTLHFTETLVETNTVDVHANAERRTAL